MGLTIAKELPYDVVEAAKIRIRNVFSNGTKVYLSFSGGKDSIVLIDLVYKLILAGEINPAQLEVEFIDEEAMYDCVIDICKEWRSKILMCGAEFKWYCLETRNYNCLNSLEDDENFIYWDRYKRDLWVRQMPPFAITSHPLLRPRVDRYQEFLSRIHQDGLCLVGARTAESINRKKYIGRVTGKGKKTGANIIYPIYDMKDGDVWLYIKENNLSYPKVYEYQYQLGMQKNKLRISQFFAIDTVKSLSRMYEYYPELAERINRREPNAYIVQLYFDTEMFRRNTKQRKQLEETEEDNKDYQALFLDVVANPTKYFKNPHYIKIAGQYRKIAVILGPHLNRKDYKRLYESIMAGDTKMRTLRAIYSGVMERAMKEGMNNNG